MNNTAVTEEVNCIKNSPALLLWYTGDEPDGTSDPLNATTTAYDLIYSLDGYHPVSHMLNCENYFWTEYTAGTVISLLGPYASVVTDNGVGQNTPCTPDYGDCGCDNCKGDFDDISTRMDEFAAASGGSRTAGSCRRRCGRSLRVLAQASKYTSNCDYFLALG